MTALRRAGAEDAPAIAELTRKAYAKWVDLLGREPLPMLVDYAEALARHRFDVMERGGRLVGLIETVADRDFLLVVNVAVDPAWQGQGVGAELMALAERLAGEAHFRGLRLYTNSRFAANIRFYERLGFEREREAPLNGGVALYMTKRFAATNADRA
jgi:ribosomal protein S18 acetylase RimI-like enzyme